MNEKNERINQLMGYTKLLENMQRAGFNCKAEMKETMEELHELVMPRKDALNIVILERGLNVEKTADIYANMLNTDRVVRIYHYPKNLNEERKMTRHLELRKNNVTICIVNEDEELPEYFIPKTITHVINNTNNFHLPEKLGIKTV